MRGEGFGHHLVRAELGDRSGELIWKRLNRKITPSAGGEVMRGKQPLSLTVRLLINTMHL